MYVELKTDESNDKNGFAREFTKVLQQIAVSTNPLDGMEFE